MELNARPDWVPATEAEAAMAAAVRAGDRLGYLRALADAPLVLPVSVAAAAGREPVAWATSVAAGTTFALAFTSPLAVPPDAPSRAARESPLFDVVSAIRDRGWGLAIDPGLPIQAFLSPEALDRLLGWEAEWVPVDAALRAAVVADDREAYLSALVPARIVLPLRGPADESRDGRPGGEPAAPAPEPAAPHLSRDVTDPEFGWWRTERVDGVPVILGFTSAARMHAELGDREWVEVPFLEVLAAWPDWGCGLRLNPGAPIGTELAGAALEEMNGRLLRAIREHHAPPPDAGHRS